MNGVYKTVKVLDCQRTGAAMRREREKAGIGLREMARRMEMDYSLLSKMERGIVQFSVHWVSRFNTAMINAGWSRFQEAVK